MPMAATPSAEAQARFDALCETVCATTGAVRASMFGMPSLKLPAGKAFCGLFGEGVVFRLAGEIHAEALALPGAQLFDPAGGRPMKQWVQLGPENQAEYERLALAAATSV